MISVIIPAHNEAKVIGRCLTALLSGQRAMELQIVVVCNGCTDNTADIARQYGNRIAVVEVEEASKTNALNVGESLAHSFPRFYLDADIVIDSDAVMEVSQSVSMRGVLAAAATYEFDLSQSSPAVRAYYHVWRRMPYFDSGRIAGAYALSEEGRRRFGQFPSIISDDGFVRLHFRSNERVTVADATARVTAPRTWKDLIKIRSRSRVGTLLLRKEYPHLFANENSSPAGSVLRVFSLRFPLRWLAMYAAVSLVSRLQARIRLLTHTVSWERDESSRTV